ncbi:hypothetical protein M885DRAFT_622489 [Pelagophyceae sp. CCMP2097]|nr:hypothetical protein M885DRAFT_622489 [Pelagophyceae sp. CCMP2097]
MSTADAWLPEVSEASREAAVSARAALDVASAALTLVAAGALAALSVGLRVAPANAAAPLLLVAAAGSGASSLAIARRRLDGAAARALMALWLVLALVALLTLAVPSTACARAACNVLWQTDRRLISDGDEFASNHGGHVCVADGHWGGKTELWGTWFDGDFRRRKADDGAWWGFASEADCRGFVQADVDVAAAVVSLAVIGAIPKLATLAALLLALRRARRDEPRPKRVELAHVRSHDDLGDNDGGSAAV